MTVLESIIEEAIDAIIGIEKGYIDDPKDRGGKTRYGVTEAVARADGYPGPMNEFPLKWARCILRKRYVLRPRFDQVLEVNINIGKEMIDTGVHIGPHHATDFLQRWLNAFNDTGNHYQDLFVDGQIGKLTIDALTAFLKRRGKDGVTVMMDALNSLQATRYLYIVEADRTQRKFLYGWMRKRVCM